MRFFQKIKIFFNKMTLKWLYLKPFIELMRDRVSYEVKRFGVFLYFRFWKKNLFSFHEWERYEGATEDYHHDLMYEYRFLWVVQYNPVFEYVSYLGEHRNTANWNKIWLDWPVAFRGVSRIVTRMRRIGMVFSWIHRFMISEWHWHSNITDIFDDFFK